jgi:hypothetical protein
MLQPVMIAFHLMAQSHLHALAFDRFWESKKSSPNIDLEGKLLREIRKIMDELFMMTTIKTQQKTVAES